MTAMTVFVLAAAFGAAMLARLRVSRTLGLRSRGAAGGSHPWEAGDEPARRM